jgi:predicted  nucleic acid-binding Zn-ribbon protein
VTPEVETSAQIIGALVAIAGGLNYWRLKSSSTTRQLKDDANANTFYSDLTEQLKRKDERIAELEKQNQAMWAQIVDVQQKASDAKYESSLWMYKFGVIDESNKLLQERDKLKEAALQAANDEIQRLREGQKGDQ